MRGFEGRCNWLRASGDPAVGSWSGRDLEVIALGHTAFTHHDAVGTEQVFDCGLVGFGGSCGCWWNYLMPNPEPLR